MRAPATHPSTEEERLRFLLDETRERLDAALWRERAAGRLNSSARYEARVLNTAMKYAWVCDQVSDLTKEARAITCATPSDSLVGPYGGLATCMDILIEDAGMQNGAVGRVSWWEAEPETLTSLCAACAERVRIFRERYALKRSIPGFKASLMRAFRAIPLGDAKPATTNGGVK